MRFPLAKFIGSILLIGGTSIGAGMLALPVVTGLGGFLPSIAIYLACWLFSMCTGFLLLEVCLWMPKDANIISMSHRLLGRAGKAISWLLYLFLFYCLTIAYVAKGGHLIAIFFRGSVPSWFDFVIFSGIFGLCVYLGARVVDRVNAVLMVGLGVAYFAFIFFGLSEVDLDFLQRANWLPAIMGLPVVFTSFSFQGIIPSLTSYMEYRAKMIRIAIVIGTSLPFIFYVVWEFLVLGLVPIDGAHGLLRAEAEGWTAIEPMRFLFQNSPIYKAGQFFEAFALTTSFLGVTLGLLDCLADGLQISKVGGKRVVLALLVYLPPVVIASIDPSIFLRALGYAGGIGCALLLGLLPIIMVWIGRYKRGFARASRQLLGGRGLLCLLAGVVLFEICVEVMRDFT